MKFDHRDIVVLFSKIIATIINYLLMIGFIIIIGIVIYTFYLFIVDPYHGKKDPSKLRNNINTPTTYIGNYSDYKV